MFGQKNECKVPTSSSNKQRFLLGIKTMFKDSGVQSDPMIVVVVTSVGRRENHDRKVTGWPDHWSYHAMLPECE